MELADTTVPTDWESYARTLFALSDAQAISLIDRKRGITRIALLQDGQLCAALFTGPDPVAVSRDHLASLPRYRDFLDRLGGRWNISLFHYRNHGSDFGRVLAGFEVPGEPCWKTNTIRHGACGLPYT